MSEKYYTHTPCYRLWQRLWKISAREEGDRVSYTAHSLLQQPPKQHCTCADSSFTGDTARFSATPCTECCREKMSEAGEQNLVELLLGKFCLKKKKKLLKGYEQSVNLATKLTRQQWDELKYIEQDVQHQRWDCIHLEFKKNKNKNLNPKIKN